MNRVSNLQSSDAIVIKMVWKKNVNDDFCIKIYSDDLFRLDNIITTIWSPAGSHYFKTTIMILLCYAHSYTKNKLFYIGICDNFVWKSIVAEYNIIINNIMFGPLAQYLPIGYNYIPITYHNKMYNELASNCVFPFLFFVILFVLYKY